VKEIVASRGNWVEDSCDLSILSLQLQKKNFKHFLLVHIINGVIELYRGFHCNVPIYNVPEFGSLPPLFLPFPLPVLKMTPTVPMFRVDACVENASPHSPSSLTLPFLLAPFHNSLFCIPVLHCFVCSLFSGGLPWHFTGKSIVF
jgi:hypothetical protein